MQDPPSRPIALFGVFGRFAVCVFAFRAIDPLLPFMPFMRKLLVMPAKAGPKKRSRKITLGGNARDGNGPSHSDTTPIPAELECEGCRLTFPSEKFQAYLLLVQRHVVEQGEAVDPEEVEEPLRLCDHCATYGPPMENPLAKLSQPEINALAVLAAGGSMRRAAAVMGVSERQMRAYLTGREKQTLRAAYAKLLLQIGITPERLARVIDEALTAEKPYWNRTTETFQMFPDHAVRVRAAEMAQRVLGLTSPNEQPEQLAASKAASVVVQTNLGDGKQMAADEAYTIAVRRVPAPRTIEAERIEDVE